MKGPRSVVDYLIIKISSHILQKHSWQTLCYSIFKYIWALMCLGKTVKIDFVGGNKVEHRLYYVTTQRAKHMKGHIDVLYECC